MNLHFARVSRRENRRFVAAVPYRGAAGGCGVFMFESLSDRLSGVFRSFGGRGQLTEENVQAGLREVRLALLEADVNFKVVKDFVESVREKCLGQETLKGVSRPSRWLKSSMTSWFLCWAAKPRRSTCRAANRR